MSILDIQARLRRLGNIRMGDKGPKGNPIKLETWRLTSPDRQLLQTAADTYGGQVTPWNDQHQLITNTDSLPVEVAPQNLTANQHLELWSAGGLQRRCDGTTATVANGEGMIEKPCVCDPDNRDCSPHTGVDFFLYELPGIGVWRLSSTGWNAANEMAALVPMLQGSAAKVTLRLEKRVVKQGGTTRRFVVPVIDAPVSLGALREGQEGVGRLSLSGPPDPAVSPWGLEAGTGSEPSDVVVVGDDRQASIEEVTVVPLDTKSVTTATVPASEDSGSPPWLSDLEGRVVQSFDDVAAEVQAHLLVIPQEGTMDDNEVWVRKLFRLMERGGYWNPARDGKDALHVALFTKHGVSHLGQLKAKELAAFTGQAATAAKEKIG